MRCWDKEEKSTQLQQKDITRRDKSEGTSERRRTKNIRRQDQTIQTKQDLPKQQKKILSSSRGEKRQDKPATGCIGGKTILVQNMETEGSKTKKPNE